MSSRARVEKTIGNTVPGHRTVAGLATQEQLNVRMQTGQATERSKESLWMQGFFLMRDNDMPPLSLSPHARSLKIFQQFPDHCCLTPNPIFPKASLSQTYS
jgi:hypothetical protein